MKHLPCSRLLAALASTVLLSVSLPASAQFELPEPEPVSPLDNGFYGALSLTNVSPDRERGLDDGNGYQLSVGYRFGKLFAVQARIHAADLDVMNGGGDASMEGFGADVLYFPASRPWLENVYVTFGIGTLETDYESQGVSFEGETFEAGIGYMQPFTLGGIDFGVRGDVRSRHNNNASGTNADNQNVSDTHMSLGVVIPFGGLLGGD